VTKKATPPDPDAPGLVLKSIYLEGLDPASKGTRPSLGVDVGRMELVMEIKPVSMILSVKPNWGQTPWTIDFHPHPGPVPTDLDFAVVGAGFTGLSAAACLRRLDPRKRVAVFEADTLGAGSSSHTGGLALAETAAGDLPGLGDVLAGFSNLLHDLDVPCDLALPGVWELDRTSECPRSPLLWQDSGPLRMAREVPGGMIDPGKLLSGLARSAVRHGALILENSRVENMGFGESTVLHVCGKQVQARRVLVATNAASLELSAMAGRAEPKFTLALATEPLSDAQLDALGLASGKPFYTIDLPYLWGRLLHGNGVLFGSGLVHLSDWRELLTLDITSGEPARLMANLELRVHGLHPALRDVRISHRWGGPILIGEEWRPVFAAHPQSPQVTVLGAYSGHGVALSVYLGSWAAEVMLQRRSLPVWPSA
jgi:glycine/D-amino acid oxidase-like deaminating enzyme